MRRYVGLIFTVGLGLFMTFANNSLNAQCENKWGEDSVACVKNNSLYTTYYKQKNYKDAYKFWKYTYDSCPCISANIYIKGVNIYKNVNKDKLKSKTTALPYIDTLMMIYDQRMKYYNKKVDIGKAKAAKAVDLFVFSFGNVNKIIEAHKTMAESIEILGKSSKYSSLNNFINISVTLFKAGKRTNQETFEDYVLANDILEYQLASPKFKKKHSKIEDVKLKNDKLIVSNDVLVCDVLIPYFTPKFKGDDTDKDDLTKMVAFLSTAGCVDEPLFEKALVVNIKKNPSSQAYQTGASFFKGKNNYTKSIEYYKKALELEENAEVKADICFKISDMYVGKVANYPAARKYAYKALEYKPNWGWPYIIIGSAYAASGDQIPPSCSLSSFSSKVVYWVAVDKIYKAKSIDNDPDLQKQADAMISDYSARFPNNEDAFFCEYKDGDSYTVGGWINEKTTIRTIKK